MSNRTSNGNSASEKLTDPEKTDDIDRVERAVNQLVVERARVKGKARRDVHLKHHGLLQGTFSIDKDIPAELQQGVFQAGREYKAWLRFSSSNKFRQSDAEGDGRGIAIKLLEVDQAGPRLSPPGIDQKSTQDFLLINGPAFFARNAADMAVAAELQQKDQFPSSFFASVDLLKGLAALIQMAETQADSPLELTYFSQTPYKLGAASYGVKYRLKPILVPPATGAPGTDAKPKGDDYLFEALRERLAPPKPGEPPGTVRPEAVFEFAVQLGRPDGEFPLDDATVVWSEEASPFLPVAKLHIPPQKFDSDERMTLAENISFNPWNGFEPHCPLGSLNAARIYAYRASRDARHRLNNVTEAKEFEYTEAEWETRRNEPGSRPYKPEPSEHLDTTGKLINGFALLFPRAGRLLAGFLSSRWGYSVAPAILFGLFALSYFKPELFEGPLLLAADALPSERMIPEATFSAKRQNTKFAKDQAARERDPRWLFRYGAIGTEAGGGIPYWIFRALPRMFPERFGGTGDWSRFGLNDRDDDEYYSNYHDLPRGVILTKPEANLAGSKIDLSLQVVAFNCATCHRGQYLDSKGKPHFIDGMPNTLLDPGGYKQVVIQSFRDERFNAPAVIAAINDLLALEHARRPTFSPDSNDPTPSRLSPIERLAYTAIVTKAKQTAFDKPIAWLDTREKNGPGRLDAFGALRYEFLGYPSSGQPAKIATVDLPSIWHQSPDWRKWHHYDGNTDDAEARNFGSIIGVGGNALTINKSNMHTIGGWLDGNLESGAYDSSVPQELSSPAFPADLGSLDEGEKQKGKDLFEAKCAHCHGTYSNGQLVKRPACMERPDSPPEGAPNGQVLEDDPNWLGCGKAVAIGTDSCRARAIDPTFVLKLNALGATLNVWPDRSFRSTAGYVCPPLDGIWARAPYLHNGSVPTLDALLGPLKDRPKTFWRGNPTYDVKKGGFVSERAADRTLFEFDTQFPGNSATGHDQIVEDEDERKALIVYLLSL